MYIFISNASLLPAGEARRAGALAAILAKQQEAAANVREAAERRRAAEAERLAQLQHRQRRKEQLQVSCIQCDDSTYQRAPND